LEIRRQRKDARIRIASVAPLRCRVKNPSKRPGMVQVFTARSAF
jgi:hypothetical protein